MSQIHTPFNGLFKTDGHLFDGGFRWDFDHSDLNESAKALFHHLDRVFEILRAPGFAFLSTIELDAEPGRFPEVLSQYFWDPDWADTQSFFVAAIARTAKESTYPVGRLTFEATEGQTVRVLAQNGGFRWGAGLRVWGLQVQENDIPNTINRSRDNSEDLKAVEAVARAAWLADVDLNALELWIAPSLNQSHSDKLVRMRTA
jgi:hypothetical protein